jgi:hypothetical protein
MLLTRSYVGVVGGRGAFGTYQINAECYPRTTQLSAIPCRAVPLGSAESLAHDRPAPIKPYLSRAWTELIFESWRSWGLHMAMFIGGSGEGQPECRMVQADRNRHG